MTIKKKVLSIGLFFILHLAVFAQTDQIMQISTIDALLSGVYDSDFQIGKLKQYGDFGLGTFNALDGEMVVLNSNIYQIPHDGKAILPPLETCTPFAVVTFFKSDKSLLLNQPLNFKQLEQFIDKMLPTTNIFYGIKIKGLFKTMKARSVARQEKPYRQLKEIVNQQAIFDFENTEGTIVGFRFPSYFKGINVPGYHLHYLTVDEKAGGHVLDFVIENAQLEIDEISNFSMIIPNNEHLYHVDLSKDRQEDLDKVEKLQK
jgi:acetolactate decarboxylase